MGSASQAWLEQSERGWFSLGHKHVCVECFSDDEIRDYMAAKAVSTHCDYCDLDSDRLFAAEIDDVMELIARSIYSEWTDPVHELPYDSAEGGYQGTTYYTHELLWDLEFPSENEKLIDDIAESLCTKLWCRRNAFFPPESKALLYSWKEFCEAVKHRTRYMFFPEETNDLYEDGSPLTRILDRIGELVFDLQLVTTLARGTSVFRGRIHDPAVSLEGARALGSPPVERARYSSRMSPAGIPMFYGAFDEETVVAELGSELESTHGCLTIARFGTVRDLTLVDLTVLPEVPSLFSDERRRHRAGISFLHEFVRDVSRPIEKDGLEHIEYVPSQVVTEYFRHRFMDEKGRRPDGIAYPSAQRQGGVALVVFATNEQCVDEGSPPEDDHEPILALKESYITRVRRRKKRTVRSSIVGMARAIRRGFHRVLRSSP